MGHNYVRCKFTIEICRREGHIYKIRWRQKQKKIPEVFVRRRRVKI